jgi:hypothetical protein
VDRKTMRVPVIFQEDAWTIQAWDWLEWGGSTAGHSSGRSHNPKLKTTSPQRRFPSQIPS